MNKKYQAIVYTFLIVTGIILFTVGFTILSPEEYSRMSGVFIGIGIGLAVMSFSLLLTLILNSRLPDDIKKIKEIEVNDERNALIREKSGYKTCIAMSYVLCIFIIAIGLMGADLEIILMAIAVLAIQFILIIYYSNKYSKTL